MAKDKPKPKATPKAKAKTKTYRRYSDDQRANALAALAANGGNIKRTSRDLGIPQQTLREWSKGLCHPAVTELRDQKKGTLAQGLEEMAWKLIGVVPEALKDCNIQQLATALGITIDKMQLLRNKPTEITRTEGQDDLSTLTDDELERRLEEARNRAGVSSTSEAGSGEPGAGGDPGREGQAGIASPG